MKVSQILYSGIGSVSIGGHGFKTLTLISISPILFLFNTCKLGLFTFLGITRSLAFFRLWTARYRVIRAGVRFVRVLGVSLSTPRLGRNGCGLGCTFSNPAPGRRLWNRGCAAAPAPLAPSPLSRCRNALRCLSEKIFHRMGISAGRDKISRDLSRVSTQFIELRVRSL